MFYIFFISLISALELPIDFKLTPASSQGRLAKLLDKGLRDFFDREYFVRLYIGNPKQKMNLAVNLKNSISLIPLVNCSCHPSSNRYSPNDSDSFKNTSETFAYN